MTFKTVYELQWSHDHHIIIFAQRRSNLVSNGLLGCRYLYGHSFSCLRRSNHRHSIYIPLATVSTAVASFDLGSLFFVSGSLVTESYFESTGFGFWSAWSRRLSGRLFSASDDHLDHC